MFYPGVLYIQKVVFSPDFAHCFMSKANPNDGETVKASRCHQTVSEETGGNKGGSQGWWVLRFACFCSLNIWFLQGSELEPPAGFNSTSVCEWFWGV